MGRRRGHSRCCPGWSRSRSPWCPGGSPVSAPRLRSHRPGGTDRQVGVEVERRRVRPAAASQTSCRMQSRTDPGGGPRGRIRRSTRRRRAGPAWLCGRRHGGRGAFRIGPAVGPGDLGGPATLRRALIDVRVVVPGQTSVGGRSRRCWRLGPAENPIWVGSGLLAVSRSCHQLPPARGWVVTRGHGCSSRSRRYVTESRKGQPGPRRGPADRSCALTAGAARLGTPACPGGRLVPVGTTGHR